MNKRAQFFIDDVIWLFRDLTRKKPLSLFDNPFMACLKKAYEEYGVKTQLNVFYKTSFWYGNDEFSLSDMTDFYKKEFEQNGLTILMLMQIMTWLTVILDLFVTKFTDLQERIHSQKVLFHIGHL